MGENSDAVKERWADFAKGDLDGATSTTDENAEIRIPETLPWGGTYKGPEGFKEMIQKFPVELRVRRPESHRLPRGRRRRDRGRGRRGRG